MRRPTSRHQAPRRGHDARDPSRQAPSKGRPSRGEPRAAHAARHPDPRHATKSGARAHDARPSRNDGRPSRNDGPSPAKVVPTTKPNVPLVHGEPRVGDWLFTTREGAERDLADEFRLLKEPEAPRLVVPALLVAKKCPRKDGRIPLTFCRQAFPIVALAEGETTELAGTLANAAASKLGGAERYALQVWVPDSTEANPLAAEARDVEGALEAALSASLPGATRIPNRALTNESVPLVQVCLWSSRRAAIGVTASTDAPSLAPGGRARSHVGGDRPSRAARKIAEALAWLGMAPEPGEVCVDLGAAPGGWTWFLLERRAKVIAVDPARLRPDLLARRGLTYVSRSAFDFEPDEPVDWVFCDMAWRPLEVAEMLGRWARRRSATLLVANFKLPMKQKADMVARVHAVLEKSGWRAVRSRQLYHDRDEITVTARLG